MSKVVLRAAFVAKGFMPRELLDGKQVSQIEHICAEHRLRICASSWAGKNLRHKEEDRIGVNIRSLLMIVQERIAAYAIRSYCGNLQVASINLLGEILKPPNEKKTN